MASGDGNVSVSYTWDSLNRLTSLTTPNTNSGYLYQLGPTDNRTNATEITGRSINWSYDGIYRLTNETISRAPSKANGSVSYGLDPAGNRLSTSSTISGINSGAYRRVAEVLRMLTKPQREGAPCLAFETKKPCQNIRSAEPALSAAEGSAPYCR